MKILTNIFKVCIETMLTFITWLLELPKLIEGTDVLVYELLFWLGKFSISFEGISTIARAATEITAAFMTRNLNQKTRALKSVKGFGSLTSSSQLLMIFNQLASLYR
jgi:hypothetical protein